MGIRALRWTGIATLVTLMAAGCGRRARGPEGPGTAGGEASDGGSGGALQERANKVVRLVGGAVFETVIHYEGGPKESWVVMSHDGRPMQPDLEMKPGAGDNDDIDAKPVAPAAGKWAVPLRAANWCDGYDGAGQKMRFWDMEKGFLETEEAGAYVEDLRLVAIAGCDRQRYAPRQRRVQALLQAFVNKTGIAQDELTRLLRSLAAPSTPESSALAYPCGTERVVRHLLCGPRLAASSAKGEASSAKSEKPQEKSQLDRLDELERNGALDDAAKLEVLLSELVELKLLPFVGEVRGHRTGTLKVTAGGGAEGFRQGLGRPEMLAVLALDAEKTSFTELGLTLAAKETDPVVRYILLGRLGDVEDLVKSEIAKVPDDVKAKARAGMEAWRAAYKANKADMDAAYKAIAAPGDADSCALVDAAFVRLVQAKAPKSLKEAYATALDPAVNVLLGAREACHRAKGWTTAATWEGKILADARTHVGPRRAAALAFRPGRAPDRFTYLPDEQIVKGVKAAGGAVQIEFKPREWLEERENCVETNIIDRITADGRLVYRSNCTPLPPLKHSEPYLPATVDAASGAAVKKGSVVILLRQTGVPEMIFSSHADEKSYEEDRGLRVFLGVALP